MYVYTRISLPADEVRWSPLYILTGPQVKKIKKLLSHVTKFVSRAWATVEVTPPPDSSRYPYKPIMIKPPFLNFTKLKLRKKLNIFIYNLLWYFINLELPFISLFFIINMFAYISFYYIYLKNSNILLYFDNGITVYIH